MKNRLLRIALCLGIGLFSFIGFSQEYNTFDIRYQNNIKGDLTFIANNIVNRDGGTGSTEPEDPYNATGNSSTYNDWLNMQYIDVDNDPSTFSSSRATFTFPQANCNQIRYAGLYWSATYPSQQAGQPVGTNRQNDFNQVKFMVPGGSYVDVTADEIIYDGFTSTDNSMRQNSPYACYADVTALVSALPNPEGDYTVANIRSVVGSLSPGGGAAGGWTLVIVYENPTLTGKLITTFDGFARVNSANSNVNINYSGFNTIPAGPVNAYLGAAALEGDNRITGDRMRIRAASNGSFTTISNAANPASNFFNSNISLNGTITTNRNPNSVNTLGYDTDMFLLNNPVNSVIPNNETAATFRFTSNGDQYYPFFNSFNVEIIEPEIVLEKRVEDIAGNDITGAGVNLGQYLDYVLSFVNIGNDDATNYTIRDILPINVTLDELNMVLPPGVTYVYNAPTREIVFTVPDNLIEVGDPLTEIRMRVRVAENCFDFIDACTDQITNLAYSTYQGVINNNQITDDPSVSDFDSCGFVTPGATNFLLDDLESCDFTRTVQLCGDNVLLDAGDNFDTYTWYLDNNGDHLIDPGDTVITDGDPDNDPSTLLVSDTGIYIVDKDVADPCKGFQEIIIVTLFGATQTNPITDLINDTSNTVEGEIVVCPNDGEELPQVFLCGLNDTELIQINIPDAQSIVWEQLDEASCTASTPDCANKDNGCTWNTVDTGSDFLASDAGQYRLQINYQNGCFSRFYFNIYKNPLDPQYNSSDIICNTPGNITVTNMPIDYEFQLVDAVTSNILVAYQSNPSFDIATNGAYRVEMRQQGVVDGCVFVLDNIGILERNFQVDVTTRDTDCNGLGEISINVLDVEPQYYYEISQGGTTVDTYGPSDDNNYTFQNLNPGTYDVLVTTDDGCNHTEQVVIQDLTDLDLTASISQHITCREGNIQMSSSGGQTPHTYAIWSYVDEGGITQISYPTVNDIPASEFQTSVIFDILDPGDYTFIVVDRNNCSAISNTVTIQFQPAADYAPTTVVDVQCFGDSTGSIQFNLVSSNGYQLTYYLFDATTFDENNYDVNNALASNSSGVFTGLAAGDYAIVINQRKGSAACDYFEYQTVSTPTSGISGNAVLVQDYTCLQNGIIEAQGVSGGTGPYEYSIDGVNFVSGVGAETFSNLTDGTYNITIRDASGCTFVTNPVTIDPLNPPTDLTFSATPPNCPTQTSDVTVTVVDGNAPYLFEITAPSPIAATSISGNTADFDGLAPGTYTFRVTDDKGCVYSEDFTIDPVTPIGVVGQLVQNVTCFNDTDGEALFTVSGFNTSYDYTVTGPSAFNGTNETSATINLTGLDDGTYTIVVTDNETNCTATADVTINAPTAALTISAAETQPTCTTDGSVVLTSTGGWGSNTFTLTNPDTTLFGTNSTGVFNNLTQTGTYTASVTDANGCTVSTTFNLNAAVAPVLQITPNDVCYDDAVGLALTASVTSGGDGNFEYSLNGGAFTTNNVFSGLTSGTYTIDVRDGNNCTDSETITINPELTVTATAPNITACGTDTDIDITAAGGDGNYVYAVVNDGVTPTPGDFATSNPVTVTGTGDYDVYVRDNNGNAGFCEASFDIAVVQDAPISITPTVTNVTCFGGADGSITLAASGGEGPYEYSIDNGANYQTTTDFFNLTAGSYTVRVRDVNNCDASVVVAVNEPAQLVAEAQITQNYTCTQNGEITVGSVTPTSGGSGDYQYSLNGATWSAPTTGGITFTGLVDGTYSIRVRDANAISCFITLPDIIIAPLPAEPTLSFTVAYNCDGSGNITVLPNDPTYTYSLNAGAFQSSNVFNNVTPGNHTITVDYGSNCTTQANVLVESGNVFDANITAFSDITCNAGADGRITFEVENFDAINGFEYQVNGGGYSAPQPASPITLSGLTAGNYTIEVRDVLDNSCIITLNQILNEPTPVIASANLTSPATCTDGAVITATASGGTPSYIFQLENGIGGIIAGFDFATNGNNTIFTGLAPGDYIVRARDANNCEDPIDAAITVSPANGITFTTTATACYSGNNDATIQVDVTAGNGNYQFSLDGGPWMTPTPSTATTHTFINLTAGTYTIDVRDGFGCMGVQQSVTINPQLTASAVLTADLTCVADASVTINAAGGSGAYSYEWSNDGGATYFSTNFAGNVFSTNTFGTFVFRVTDTTAPSPCTVITNPIVITEAQTPVITSVTPTHVLCNGDSTGALDVVIDTSVGSPPYVINVVEINGPTNYGTQTSGLPAGDYEVTIIDNKGCVSAPFAVTINEPNAITYTINLQPITCDSMGGGTNPGSITVQNVTGGTAEFTYHLTGNNGFSGTYTTTAGGEDHTFAILEFGIYEVDVIDANGCSVRTTNIIASPPNDLDIDVSTATASCAAGGTAIVTVSSVVGSGSYQFAILETFSAPYSSTYVGPDPLPVGNTDTATFTGLVPGITYTFVVYDTVTNCYYFETASAPINSPSNMTVTSLVESNVTCTGANDGNVTFTFDNFDPLATDVTYEIFNAQSNLTTGITGTTSVNPPAGPLTVPNLGPLVPGVYYVLLREVGGPFDGCSISSPDFTIDESTNALAVTATSTNASDCSANGTISAVAQFGQAPYLFQLEPFGNPVPTPATWTGVSTNGLFTGLANGNYTVYVRDAYDCIQPFDITVGLDPRPEITVAVVDECVAEGTFEVLVTLTNPAVASAPFQLSINGGPSQNITFNGSNQYTVTGLSSGLGQTISVTDLNGCSDTDPFNIQPPLQFNAAVTTLLDCEAAPANNAEITIDVTAGSGNYDYEIDGPGAADQARTAMAGNTITWTGASAAGSYTVTVYDTSTSVPNCLGSMVVDVPPLVTPNINVDAFTDVTCNGVDDGAITVSSTDVGIGPYTYEIVSGPGSSAVFPIAPTSSSTTSATFTGLEGTLGGITYTIRATAANSCFVETTQVITQPDVVTVPAPTVVEFGCTAGNNPNNATITIDDLAITGGSGTYVIYEFIEEDDPNTVPVEAPVVVQSGGNPVYIETDPAGGVYTINVYDNNGCVGATTATIQPYDELLSATAAITNPLSCTPGSDGEITITATSTNSDPTRFEYSIDNGATWQNTGTHANPEVFTGLSAGTHNFLIRHIDTGCIITASETITDPNTFTIDVNVVNDVICFGTQSGQVTFELVDATYPGGFDWEIWDTNGTPANTADDTSVATGTEAGNGPTLPIALFAGDYYVEVTQTNFPDCTNIEAFTIAGPSAAITANVNVEEITCVPGNDGVIEITNVQGGWGGYRYYVDQVPNPDPNNPANYFPNPRFENLSAGTYEIWVIDQNGCPEQLPDETLNVPSPIAATLAITNPNCTNIEGAIEVSAPTGGQGSNYSYQLVRNGTNVGSPQTSRAFNNLGAGTYEVIVSDQWGCSLTTNAVLLYDEIVPTATVDKPIDCTPDPGGHVTISQTGGSGTFDYAVEFPDSSTPLPDILASASATFTNLTMPGTYTFTITDTATGHTCVKTIDVPLDDKVDPVLLNATITHVSCNGGSDGSILANLDSTTDDNPPYQYELIGLAGAPSRPLQNNPLFTGLPAGSYDVRVVSARGCEDIRTETITEPNALTASAVATPFACAPDNTVNTSTVTITATDGTAPYLYSIDGVNYQTGNSFEIIDNGAAQTIDFYVTDANGCPFTDSIIIQPLNTFALNASQNIAITCVNPEEVILTVTEGHPSGHTYTFELLPNGNPNGSFTSSTATTATFELSAAGSYTFRATNDTTGCYEETTYVINPYDLIDVTAIATAPAICFGDNNGALEVTINDYIGDFDFEVFDQENNPIQNGTGTSTSNPFTFAVSNLSGGNFYVRITETGAGSSLCSDDTNMVTIVSPDMPLDATPVEVANVTCTNDQGEIEVTPTGGYAPYDIVLTNNATSQVYTVNDVTSHVFTGLSEGSFDVQITDNGGCVINRSLTLTQPLPITAGIDATPTTLACYGDTNATVTAINVLNGEGVYQYQLNTYDATGTVIAFTSGAQSSPIFNNLGAGIYSITVSDDWNCGVETAQVTISEPVEVMASLIQLSPLTCNNQAQIELTATGGTGPYEFSADGSTYAPMSGGNTHTFNVNAGVYQYYIRDAFGCEAMISNQVSIDMVPPLTIDIDDSAAVINCTGEASATIITNVTGGLGNYSYELFSDAALTNLVSGPQASDTFSGLVAGNYYVRVTSQDCMEVSPVIPIVDPIPLQVDRQEFTDVTCAGENDGTISVEVSGGTGEIFYAITPNLNQFDTVNTFTDLAPGVYDVIAQDRNGCFIPFQFTIAEPSPITVTTVNVLDEVCAGSADGSIEISISGGTAPYRASLNSNNDTDFVDGQTLFNNLPAGTHVIFVRDANDCDANIIVDIAPGVNLNATVEPIYECSGNIPDNRIEVTLEDASVSGDVMYALDSTDPADLQLAPDFTNMAPGNHYLTIAHSNGCVNIVDFEIIGFEPLTLTLEQNNINEITAVAAGGLEDYTFYFGDVNNGTDNTFYINRTDTYTVTVVDQNGCEISADIFMEFIDIEIPNFFTPDGDGTNDYWLPNNLEGFPDVLMIIFDRYGRELYRMRYGDQGWDGMYQNNHLPTGDYWYVIKLQGENDDREFIGHFTLYR
ncbi:T9SS type B sorting domain-containing protein [Flagellimonas lutaonensis]|uniref:Uncharacterized protein n=1 Tax=Flagellimonas lutaonensis TaxID=516051 RepID=A0A0D5YRP8_9FLAO|nr:T9SS type B sorting domain-containing protein [Allomuricauda lutaonensis]AKA34957.1 hypothetical protein VC82_1328 [Allomuricauda lutaonensis]